MKPFHSRPAFALPRVLLCLALGLVVSVRAADAEPAPAKPATVSINLSYSGSGTVTKSQTAYVSSYNSKKKHFESGTVTATGRQPFSGSGYIEIAGATGRIKLPSDMMPLLRSDNDGWFAVGDFFMNDTEITGTIRINALNKAKLHIDRNSGGITLKSGFADFTGNCELVKTDGSQRKF